MPDRLLIADLEVSCRLGVFDWEQANPQPIWIDLEVGIDAAKAAKHDDVKDALDYARLVSLVRTLAEQHPFRLMETLAEIVAEGIRREFHEPYVRVRVKKRALPGVGYAAVEIERR
jgi:dihydroneopterin aldolase